MPVVVIDDDPTGAQTLRGVPLIFGVDRALISEYLVAGAPVICVLTNSRALSREDAYELNARVASILRSNGTVPLVVSRGDSTLRGHLSVEMQALADALYDGRPESRVFAPAFLEAGRSTSDGIHFVDVEGARVPVAQTPFAQDARFGFHSSDLREYLVEVGAAGDTSEVSVISPSLVAGGAAGVAAAIHEASGDWVVTDLESLADVDLVAAAILDLHEAGHSVLTRCAPSLVRALAGQASSPALTDAQLRAAFPARRGHGLIVVGSHVPQTSAQLNALRRRSDTVFIPADTQALFSNEDGARADLIAAAVTALETADVVLHTPREEIRDASAGGDLARSFSDALCEIVAAITAESTPAWVIAKGGITSHEVAARGLGIRAADVVGQIFDSKVSIVRATHAPERSRGLPYVIFPGNVGAVDALADAVGRLRVLTTPTSEEKQ